MCAGIFSDEMFCNTWEMSIFLQEGNLVIHLFDEFEQILQKAPQFFVLDSSVAVLKKNHPKYVGIFLVM